MIEANEYYILNELKELGIDKTKIKDILRKFAGWRIYFRKKQSEYEEIRNLYEQMISAGASRSQAVKELAEIFGRSKGTIRKITSIQGSLF
jgi:DNA-binding transcriptional regulator YhcF (GntR family)